MSGSLRLLADWETGAAGRIVARVVAGLRTACADAATVGMGRPCPAARPVGDRRECHSWRPAVLALAGAICLFLVQPPADLWWLAWLAPLPWLRLAADDRLPLRWWPVWLAGFVHWLLTIHWLRLPHPATAIGWVALSAYLAIYLPLFLWLTRRLVCRWGCPLVMAAPLAWMATEQLRGSLLGGFTFAMLGHTQWRWTTLLQTADLGGAVGVSGLVMMVAAGMSEVVSLICGCQVRMTAADGPGKPRWMSCFRLGNFWNRQELAVKASPGDRLGQRSAWRWAVAQAACGLVILGCGLAYGRWRLATEPAAVGEPLAVLLVQGSIDTELKHDPNALADVTRHYDELTQQGLTESGSRPDLVVWPETMWRAGLLEIDPERQLPTTVLDDLLGPAPPDETPSERQARGRTALAAERLEPLAHYARRYGTHWLVGLDKQRVTDAVPAGVENFNCGLLLDPDGEALGVYAKMHPVLFGEYLPWADRFPWLYRLSPLPAGLTPGREPLLATVAGHPITCSICYETALPEAARSMVLACRRRGVRPTCLVNLTNDGWFWGSSELDMHLTAGIFRAVELRTPLAIAANTGFSAWIDGCGRLRACGPRRATASLLVSIQPDGRDTPWLFWGSLPAWMTVAIAATVMLEAVARRGTLKGMG